MQRSKIKLSYLITLIALAAVLPAGAQLSAPEDKMIAVAGKEDAESIVFLEKLVNVNSGTMNPEGVHKVADMLAPRFRALGFQVRWVPMDEVHRAGHLIAEHPAPNGKRMLLIGHLDTVFEKDSPFQTWVRNGDRATGPGSSDIKGGDMVILTALDAMQAAGVLKNASISVILTGDEERVGQPVSISRRDLVALAKQSDVALDFETASERNGVEYGSTSRRSAIVWALEASGVTGHSSGIFNPSAGYGAIYEISRIIDTFRQQLPEHGLTFNVGYVVGGSEAKVDSSQTSGSFTGKANVIPPVAFASGDIRTISDEQTQRVEAEMTRIVNQHLPKTSASIQFQDGYPAMAATPGNRAILGILNQVNKDAGFPHMEELDATERGAGDISFIAKYVDSLAGLGAMGGNGHREGEFIELDRQPVQIERAALLMYRLSKMNRATPLAPAQ